MSDEIPFKWYPFTCKPSTELRGRRPSHDGGCGYPILRKSRKPLDSNPHIQGNCPNCGRRPRVSWGNVHIHYQWTHLSQEDLLRRFQARGLMQALHRGRLERWEAENQSRSSLSSYATEENAEKIEHLADAIEQVVNRIEHNPRDPNEVIG